MYPLFLPPFYHLVPPGIIGIALLKKCDVVGEDVLAGTGSLDNGDGDCILLYSSGDVIKTQMCRMNELGLVTNSISDGADFLKGNYGFHLFREIGLLAEGSISSMDKLYSALESSSFFYCNGSLLWVKIRMLYFKRVNFRVELELLTHFSRMNNFDRSTDLY